MNRQTIIDGAKTYFQENLLAKEFVPGQTYIPPTGKVLDQEDCANLIDASLDMWFTSGRYS